jgi:hypothetical protein
MNLSLPFGAILIYSYLNNMTFSMYYSGMMMCIGAITLIGDSISRRD